MKKIMIVFLVLLLCTASLFACNEPSAGEKLLQEAESNYNQAHALLAEGKYHEAQAKFQECIGYKDAEQILARFVYKYDRELKRITHYYNGEEQISESLYEYEFDLHGYMTRLEAYDDAGELWVYDIYQYNAQGKLTRQDRFDADGELQNSYITEYNEYGHVTKREDIDYNNSINCYCKLYSYTYDDNGLMLSKAYLNDDGTAYKTETWERDVYGNPIAYSIFDKNGNITDKTRYTYEYDTAGRIVSQVNRDILGSIVGYYMYEYDENGNVAEEVQRNKNGGLVSKKAYTYDEQGRVTQQIRYKGSDAIRDKYIYEYDQYGILVSEIHYDSDGAITVKYEYEYSGVNLYYDPFL